MYNWVLPHRIMWILSRKVYISENLKNLSPDKEKSPEKKSPKKVKYENEQSKDIDTEDDLEEGDISGDKGKGEFGEKGPLDRLQQMFPGADIGQFSGMVRIEKVFLNNVKWKY